MNPHTFNARSLPLARTPGEGGHRGLRVPLLCSREAPFRGPSLTAACSNLDVSCSDRGNQRRGTRTSRLVHACHSVVRSRASLWIVTCLIAGHLSASLALAGPGIGDKRPDLGKGPDLGAGKQAALDRKPDLGKAKAAPRPNAFDPSDGRKAQDYSKRGQASLGNRGSRDFAKPKGGGKQFGGGGGRKHVGGGGGRRGGGGGRGGGRRR